LQKTQQYQMANEPWDGAPGYMIRDRDRIYGGIVTRRLRAMGIRDKPTAPVSPWQNGFAERLIGSIRRECLDHIVELVGKTVILTNGTAGTVGNIWLDEFHGLRLSIKGHEGKWPVSTIKFAACATMLSILAWISVVRVMIH
jgi:hypothetical protein